MLLRTSCGTPHYVAPEVVQKVEEMAEAMNGKFKVSKAGESVVRLQGQEKGRKGRLVIDVELFTVSSSFLMVEIKKASGDTLEFNKFCQNHLRPALVDVVWTTAAMAAAAAAASENTAPAAFNNPPCAALVF
ncbi:CBL-interacting serine/threonine-protein kinase 6 [Bienertia sinuspersici]